MQPERGEHHERPLSRNPRPRSGRTGRPSAGPGAGRGAAGDRRRDRDRARGRGVTRPEDHPQVRGAAGDPAGDAAERHAQGQGQEDRLLRDHREAVPAVHPAASPGPPPTTSGPPPCGATRSRRTRARGRRAARSTTRRFTIEASYGPRRAREVDQRPRRRERQLPAAPPARRPDPALGEPGGRPGRHRHARHGRRSRTPGRCRSSRTCTARTPPRTATAIPEAWYLPAAKNIPAGYATGGVLLRAVQEGVREALGRHVAARLGDLPVSQRPARHDAVVPRPHARA